MNDDRSQEQLVDGMSYDNLSIEREEANRVLKTVGAHSRTPAGAESAIVTYSEIEAVNDMVAGAYIDNPSEWVELFNDEFQFIADEEETGHEDVVVRVTELPDEHLYDVGDFDPTQVFDHMIALRGQVTKRTDPRIRDDVIVFVCERCGTTMTVPQSGDAWQTPYECNGCERQGPFETLDSDDRTEMQDHQLIRIQTLPEKTGSVLSQEIDVELDGDLTDEVEPGDRVVVNTIIKARRKENTRYRIPYGMAQSIEKLESDYDDVDIEPHRETVREVAQSDDPFAVLANTLAPSHWGNEHIKIGLSLQLFGGVEKRLDDGTSIRGNLHILLLGDPGTGKSTLLETVAEISPRAVQATGSQSTRSGLTAAAVQDNFGDGGWTLESGVMVQATGGVATIDELDDMDPSNRMGMTEAMSKQKLHISKVGITATLPAETSVLAAANPQYGRFNPHEQVAEQIDLENNLFSRFDLVFTLHDTPDPDTDRQVAEHMTKVNREAMADETSDDVAPELSPIELRAYVSMGQEIEPVLTEEAEQMIADAYVEMREANPDQSTVPVGPRMNEALIRLSEASARVRLSETVEPEDVERAEMVHRRYLNDFGIDPETGEYDMEVIKTGKSRAQQERNRTLKDVIRELQGEGDDDTASIPSIKAKAADIGLDPDKVDKELENWRRSGDLYEPETDEVRLM